MRSIPVAGIDVSKAFSDMCILAPNNTVFARLKIKHCQEGMNAAVKTLSRAAAALGEKPVVIMEATGHYHRLLQQFLSQRSYEVITINPLQSSAMKNLTIRKVKNDPTDAYRLALSYRTNALKPNLVPTDQIENLRMLTRQHFDLKQDITAYTQRLQAILDQTFPGFRDLFERLTSMGALAALEAYPTPDKMKSARIASLVNMMKKVMRNSKSDEFCIEKARKLKYAANEAVKICVCRASAAAMIRANIAIIRALQCEVAAIDTEIHAALQVDQELSQSAELLCSIPGIAEFSAAVILAEIGDIHHFRRAKQLVAFFGLDPSIHQSGQYVGKSNHLSKRGSKYIRTILCLVARSNVARKQGKSDEYRNPVLHAYYETKCAAKPKVVACCAVMHKLIGIIYAVLRDKTPFEMRDPETHRQLMRTRCSKAAA